MRGTWRVLFVSFFAGLALCSHCTAGEEAEKATPPGDADQSEIVYVVVDVANVRTGPGTAHDILLKAHWGDELVVLSEGGGWIRIRHRKTDEVGWIYAKLTAPTIPEKKPVALHDGTGRYDRHTYTYRRDGDRYSVLFKPVLPRDDATVIGAMLELINTVYGKHLLEDLTPRLVARGGTNIIQFTGKKHFYLFLLVKEDTGEVNSFLMWRERK